jgi:transcriptional regulator with XRE-family HTH domain
MEQDASFGRWLTLRRQAVHVQRTELAARIGCAVVTLQKIEVDERRPSRQIAERLAEQLAIPPDVFPNLLFSPLHRQDSANNRQCGEALCVPHGHRPQGADSRLTRDPIVGAGFADRLFLNRWAFHAGPGQLLPIGHSLPLPPAEAKRRDGQCRSCFIMACLHR